MMWTLLTVGLMATFMSSYRVDGASAYAYYRAAYPYSRLYYAARLGAMKGIAPIVVPSKGVAPIIVPSKGVAPFIIPSKGVAPIVVPSKGVAPIVVPSKGVAPFVVPSKGVAPIAVPSKGSAQIVVPSKGAAPFVMNAKGMSYYYASGKGSAAALQLAHRLNGCMQPKEKGICTLNFTRYYYNQEVGACDSFEYGGCGKNGNNFFTKAACEAACPGPMPLCMRPASMGVCSDFSARYYYNSAVDSCMMFVYSGCGNNGNNFETKEECEKVCPSMEPPVCERPKVVGRCLAAFPRYYYNSETGSCDMFIYGGCESNGNNFETREECEQKCSNDDLPSPDVNIQAEIEG